MPAPPSDESDHMLAREVAFCNSQGAPYDPDRSDLNSVVGSIATFWGARLRSSAVQASHQNSVVWLFEAL